MIYYVKPASEGGPGTLAGVDPLLRWGPLAWIIFAVSVVVLGRRPIVTGAAADRERADGTDDPSTLHDDGLALDLRANDRPLEVRQEYANGLRAGFGMFRDAVRVIGPYDLPDGHVHVVIRDPAKVWEQIGLAVTAAAVVVLIVARGV